MVHYMFQEKQFVVTFCKRVQCSLAEKSGTWHMHSFITQIPFFIDRPSKCYEKIISTNYHRCNCHNHSIFSTPILFSHSDNHKKYYRQKLSNTKNTRLAVFFLSDSSVNEVYDVIRFSRTLASFIV